jgi:hypothetical protein
LTGLLAAIASPVQDSPRRARTHSLAKPEFWRSLVTLLAFRWKISSGSRRSRSFSTHTLLIQKNMAAPNFVSLLQFSALELSASNFSCSFSTGRSIFSNAEQLEEFHLPWYFRTLEQNRDVASSLRTTRIAETARAIVERLSTRFFHPLGLE